MTSILNFSSASSSTPAANNIADDSLLSNKFTKTFIIQPPSSSLSKNNTTLLSKRSKPAELGDLLIKKIKTQTLSGTNSSEQSPIFKDNFDDAVYESSEGIECHSAIEEVRSPSIKSCNEDSLIPQRSISLPLFNTNFNLTAAKSKPLDHLKQLQNALETLQRNILLEQQSLILKGIIKRAQFSEALRIPSLHSNSSDSNSTSASQISRQKLRNLFVRGEDDPEVIIGEIEYPLLSMAPSSVKTETNPKSSTGSFPNMSKISGSKKAKKAVAKSSNNSSPTSDSARNIESFLDSLTVTRAETQRSEPEMGSSLKEVSEEFAKLIAGKGKKSKKVISESVEKVQKASKKEKVSKKQKNNGGLSPLASGKKLAERKKNKWQNTETNNKKTSMASLIETKVF